jgi:hypothetical protein
MISPDAGKQDAREPGSMIYPLRNPGFFFYPNRYIVLSIFFKVL